MREHRGLARARARHDEHGAGTRRIAYPVLDGALLLGIELNCRCRANQGEGHGSRKSCFLLCSKGVDNLGRIS